MGLRGLAPCSGLAPCYAVSLPAQHGANLAEFLPQPIPTLTTDHDCNCRTSWSKSLHFNDRFPGGPGLAGTRMSPFWILLELRMMKVVVTTGAIRRANCKAPVKMSPPTNQHPVYLQAGCSSCRPTNIVKALKGIAKQIYNNKSVRSLSVQRCCCVS